MSGGLLRATARRGAGLTVSWRASFRMPTFVGAVLTATLGLVVGVASVTSAPALASVQSGSHPDSTVSVFYAQPSTTAAGATEVTYTVVFQSSATGALTQGQSTVTLSLPGATFNAANALQGYVSFDDETSGDNGGVYAMQGTVSDDDSALTVTSPIDAAAGDGVEVTYTDVTNPSSAGSLDASFSTSSDSTAATSPVTITAGDQPVSGLTVTPSATAAGVSGVSYTADFTPSATGALAQNQGTVTLALPAGSAFDGTVQFEDLTSGATGTVADSRGTTSDSGATLTVPVPMAAAAGDSVQLTYTNVTNAAAGGAQQATVDTSSDTQPVAASFTLTGGQSVTVSQFSASTTAARATGVSYTAAFTTSSSGGLASGSGTITLTAPAGTTFDGPVTITDLTASAADRNGKSSAGKSSAVAKPGTVAKTSAVVKPSAAKSSDATGASGDVTETVTVPIAIASGDEVSVVWADVTNPTAAGAEDLTLATSSDTTPVKQALTLTAAGAVSSVVARASTAAAGATQVTYTVGFTASGTGALVPDEGDIILAAPAGTVFSSGTGYSADDVTSGQEFSLNVVAVLDGGTTVKLDGGDPISAGDHVVVTANGVTNPSAAGPEQLTLSTTSDTVPAAAGITLTAGNQPVAAISALFLTTTTAGASEVSYQLTFTASATGALVAGNGTVTLALPSGSSFSADYEANADFQDLTSGASGWQSSWNEGANSAGTALTITVPFSIAAGDKVRVTVVEVASAPSAGEQKGTFYTSSDTKPVTATFTLTPGSVPVTGLRGPALTATAAGASGIGYQLTFTASANGQLASGYGTITVSLAAGTTIDSGEAEIDDLTSGQTATTSNLSEASDGSAITVTVPFAVAGGDQVQVTFPGVQSAPAAGTYTATVATSSDTRPVSASYALTQAAPVAAPAVTVSNQTAGETASYGVSFTTSSDGSLVAGQGQITLAAPAGTVFSGSAAYTGQDITSGKSLTLTVAGTSAGGATITFTTGQQISGGDQVVITAPGVTNATSTGANDLTISTSTDTVHATAPYTLGDSAPAFTAASPPLAIAPGSTQAYQFTTAGWPAASYSLSGAPDWLSIDPATGKLSGTAPTSAGTFSYSVTASNSAGSATEGLDTVTIEATATISGTVVNSAGDPVSDVEVDACDTSGTSCESATTDDTGAFTLTAGAGATVVLTAYPPQGSGQSATSSPATTVPAAGLAGVTITEPTDLSELPGTLEINGSAQPTVYWASPSTATLTGCKNGLALVTVAGENTYTGKPSFTLTQLTETPAGSGDYTGTVPAQEPVHGPVQIYATLNCPSFGTVVPSAGPADGGTEVLVTGSGFTGVTAVDFGTAAAESFTIESDGAIEAVAPPGTGTVPVTVYDSGSPRGDDAGQFIYEQVTSISPATGPTSGGTWVVIDGSGLVSADGVLFGKTPAQQFYVLSDTQVEALSPQGTGTQDITVEMPDGSFTPAVAADRFGYGAPPASGAHPATAPATVPSATVPSRLATAAASTALSTVSSAKAPATVTRPQNAASDLNEILIWILQHPDLSEAIYSLEKSAGQEVASLIQGGNCEMSIQALVTAAMIPISAALDVALAFALPFLALIPGLGWLVGAALIAVKFVLGWVLENYVETMIEAYLTNANCEQNKQYWKGYDTPPPLHIPNFAPPGGFSFWNCILHPSTCGQPDAYVDPSGTVLDTNGNPVKGATVTILRSYTEDGGYLPASPSQPGLIPAVNPEVTGANGAFHWDVSAGFYKIEATAPGCTAVGSSNPVTQIGPYPVPPPQVGLTITMQCANEAKPAPPTVTGLSATTGPTGGGTVVTVTGTNFTPASKVTFGTTTAAVTYLSQQALTVTAPKGSGTLDVRVTTAGGTSGTSAADKFFFGTAPSVTKLSPSSGPASGGTTVTITGSNLTGTTAVNFGGVSAAKFTVKSATQIVAVTGKGFAGVAGVQVTNPAGSSSPVTFNYLAPVAGYVATSAGIVPIAEGATRAGTTIKVADPAALAATPDGDTLVVPGGKGATEISTANGQPGGAIPAGKTPRAVAITPSGATAYVLNYGSGTVTPIAVATSLAGRAIGVGSDPTAIAITPNGTTAYVVNYGSATVTPITIATGKAGTAIKVGSHPDAIAITPNGATAYVVNSGSGTVTPITVSTGKAGKAITTGKTPDAIAITSSGKTLYVVNSGSGTVTPITVSTGKAGKAITAGKTPDAIAITPNGATAYVVNSGSGTVTPITVSTGKAGTAVTVGKDPVAAAVTPDGTILYVLNHGAGTVTPVTVATGKPGKAISVGADPAAVTITR